MKLFRTSTLAMVFAVVLAVPAFAQDAASDAYSPPNDPGLPMTGFDLALLVGGGLALLLVGVVLRRAAGRASS